MHLVFINLIVEQIVVSYDELCFYIGGFVFSSCWVAE